MTHSRSGADNIEYALVIALAMIATVALLALSGRTALTAFGSGGAQGVKLTRQVKPKPAEPERR